MNLSVEKKNILIRILKTIFLTLLSPILAIPFSYLLYVVIAVYDPPGLSDPLRETMGSTRYVLRWAVLGPFYEVLIFDNMLKEFYISLPLLFSGNYALIAAVQKIQPWPLRLLILLSGAGLFFAAVTFGGLWLGLWEEPFWT